MGTQGLDAAFQLAAMVHVDMAHRSFAAFEHLNNLVAGDMIQIEMGNGTIYNYRVYDNFEVKLSEADKKMSMLSVSPVNGEESISIISCIGEWSLKQQTYLSRQFLRATRV